MDSYNLLQSFIQPKRGKYKTLNQIHLFIMKELTSLYHFRIGMDYNILQRYTDKIDEIYSKYNIVVYFLNEQIRIEMSIHIAKNIPVINNIFENKFKEKALRLMYYDKKNKIKMTGSYIIILTIPIESIIIYDDILLIDKIKTKFKNY
jgi:hypothetical protein